MCLLVGGLLLELERRFAVARRTNMALVVCVVLLGGYQVTRAIAAARDMKFSTAFMAAVAEHQALRAHRGMVWLTPGTPETGQLLQNTIGGYLRSILQMTFSRTDIDGGVGEPDADGTSPGALRLLCEYIDGRVLLRQSIPPP